MYFVFVFYFYFYFYLVFAGCTTQHTGWQRFKVNARLQDDSDLLGEATFKPLKNVPPPRDLGSLDQKLWNKEYSASDLKPLKEEVRVYVCVCVCMCACMWAQRVLCV